MTVSEAEFQSLVGGLGSDDENARKQAVFRLAKSGDLRAIDHLKRLGTQDPSQEVRYLCRKALQFMASQEPAAAQQVRPVSAEESLSGAPFDILGKRLASPEPGNRASALKAILKTQQVDLLPEVIKMVASETHPDVRSLLPVIIGKLGNKSHVPHLAKLLEDKDPRVRSNTIEALENVKEISAYALIVRSLQDEDHRVIVTAVKALSTLGKLNLIQVCDQMLKTQQYWMRDSAAYCLAQSKFTEALPLLERCLDDAHESVRQKARVGIEKLSQQGSQEASGILTKFKDVDPLPPAAEFNALEQLSKSMDTIAKPAPPPEDDHTDASIQPLLRKLKGETDGATIVRTLRALGAVKNPVIAPIVKDYLQHPEVRVRRAALEVLEVLPVPERAAWIRTCLDDLVPEIVEKAQQVLRNLEGVGMGSLPPPVDDLAALGGSDEVAPAPPSAPRAAKPAKTEKPAKPPAKAEKPEKLAKSEKPAAPRVTGAKPSGERPALAPPLTRLVKGLLFLGIVLEILGYWWVVALPISLWTWNDATKRLTDRIKVRWLFRIHPILWGLLSGPLAPLFLTLYLMLRAEYARIASRGKMIGDRYEDALDLFGALRSSSVDFWGGLSSRQAAGGVGSADLDDLPFHSAVDVPIQARPAGEDEEHGEEAEE